MHAFANYNTDLYVYAQALKDREKIKNSFLIILNVFILTEISVEKSRLRSQSTRAKSALDLPRTLEGGSKVAGGRAGVPVGASTARHEVSCRA